MWVAPVGISRREHCRYCQKVYGNRWAHEQVCKAMLKLKKKETKRKERKLIEELRSRELDEPAQRKQSRADLASLAEFMHQFGLFLKNDLLKAAGTCRMYTGALRNFFEKVLADEPDLQLWTCLSTEWKSRPDLLTVNHITRMRKEVTKRPGYVKNTLQALLLYADFVEDHTNTYENSMPEEWRARLTRHTERIRSECRVILKTVPKKAAQQLQNNMLKSQQEHSLKTRPKTVLRYIGLLKKSERFAQYIKDSVATMPEKLCAKGISGMSAQQCRNIAIGLLLLEGHGVRGEALLKLTKDEWRQTQEAPWIQRPTCKVKILVGRSHKTSQTYGGVTITVGKPIWDFVNAYYTFAYPTLLDNNTDLLSNLNMPLFPSSRARPMETGLSVEESWRLNDVSDSMLFLRQQLLLEGVQDQFDPQLNTITSGAMRKAFAFYGNTHSDPNVREGMPKLMQHSATVAAKFYVVNQTTRGLDLYDRCVEDLSKLEDSEEEEEEEEEEDGIDAGDQVPVPVEPVVPTASKILPIEKTHLSRLFPRNPQGKRSITTAHIESLRGQDSNFAAMYNRLVGHMDDTSNSVKCRRKIIQKIRTALKGRESM